MGVVKLISCLLDCNIKMFIQLYAFLYRCAPNYLQKRPLFLLFDVKKSSRPFNCLRSMCVFTEKYTF
jgi:hypothetical protein